MIEKSRKQTRAFPSVMEITGLKRIQDNLAASEERFRLIAEATNDVLWDWDLVNRRVWWSEDMRGVLGCSGETKTRDEWMELVHPADREDISSRLQSCLAGHSQTCKGKFRLRRSNGTYGYFAARILIVRNDSHQAVRVLGAMSDITDMKRFEAECETLSMAVEQTAESIVFSDPDGTITYVNPSFERISGYTRDEVIGKNPRIMQSGEHAPEFYDDMWQTLTQGGVWSGYITNKRKDGTLWEEETIISPVRDENGAVLHYVAVKRDLTDRKQAEADTTRLSMEVVKQKQQLDSIMKSVPGVVWEAWGKPNETTQRIAYINDYVEILLGYSVAEWLATPNLWLSIVDSADKERVAQDASALFNRGEAGTMEFRWTCKDGRKIWVEARITTIKDERGESIGQRGVNIDITDRKALEAQLRQSQKMEAVGAFAAGIAHDFNNMLTVINGYSDLAISGLDSGDPLRRKLEEIKNAGSRAASLTRQLLIFSRKQVLQPSVFNINSVIQDLEKMLGRLIGEHIELRTVLGAELGTTRADRGQMEQVVMNLAVNARDAMPGGGKFTIETARVSLGEEYVRRHMDGVAGSYVMLAVSDNGIGMDAQTQARIFEPFFTTKEAGKGTGLGLSTVYGIVRQWDGFVSVYSEVGLGTTFKIYFPSVTDQARESQDNAARAALDRGTETILLTEDDESVRKATRSMLEQYGYRVLEAANAEQAVSICEQHAEPIQLLLTDVIMPQGNGAELARALTQSRAGLSVLYMSGYTDNAMMHQGFLGGSSFIQKPFDARLLAQKVREVLQQK